MSPRLLAAFVLFAAAPALAAQQPPAASLYHQEDSRSISIQNWSGQPVTAAQVQTTDGHTWDIGKGVIPQNQAKEIIVPAQECIANVRVTLQDGRTLGISRANACRNTQVVVRDNGISIPAQAAAGTQPQDRGRP
jgi:hypothetical protein